MNTVLPSSSHRTGCYTAGPSRLQLSLYWRTWAAVCAVHGWRGSAETIAATRQTCWVSPALNQDYQRIWDLAIRLDSEDSCQRSADALRHACHIVATGRNVSSQRLTNAELDRILDLFRLLADPENLANLAAWQNAECGARRRLVHAITQSDTPYWRAIAADKFHETDLARLTLEQLQQLALTLRMRAASRRAHAAALSL